MPEWNCLSGLWGKLVIGLLLARLKELFKSKRILIQLYKGYGQWFSKVPCNSTPYFVLNLRAVSICMFSSYHIYGKGHLANLCFYCSLEIKCIFQS